MTPFPTQDNVLDSMRSFLLAALPAGVEVVAAQPNRVPEPQSSSFVIMTPTRSERLSTNIDTFADASFTGSISGNAMTVSAVAIGSIQTGATLFGTTVVAGTVIQSQSSGTTGGAGTYLVTVAQTIASGPLAAGQKIVETPEKWTVQLDFHSLDSTAGDMARMVQALMRDDFAVDQFAGQSPNYGVAPLYSDDPRYMVFINDSMQAEWRWILEAFLQVNTQVTVPQQFSDTLSVVPVSVDAAYPPA